MVEYIVNQKTQVIAHSNLSYLRSKIIEENRVLYNNKSPNQIINETCTKYGADLNGRGATVSEILQLKSKLPIPVIPHKNIYFFPTKSIHNKANVWLAYNHVKKFESISKNKVMITFYDETALVLDVSFNQFDLQFNRTSKVIRYFQQYGIEY